MTVGDLIRMAIHNLWSRKLRTLLNLLGIVVSCVMLIMTLAGTRGASDGVRNIINSSAQTRRFMIQTSYSHKASPPAEAIEVQADVSPERRERIEELLRVKWVRANATRVFVDEDVLQQLRSIENLATVVPRGPLTVQLRNGAETIKGSTVGVRLDDSGLKQRLVVGEIPQGDDPTGILIDEFTAYNMGYQGDDSLAQLIGKRLEIEIPLGRHQLSGIIKMLGPLAGDFELSDTIEFVTSVKQLVGQLDQTNLTDQQKQAIRSGLKKVAATKLPAANTAGDQGGPPASTAAGSADVKVDRQGNRILVRDAYVRGIIQRPLDDDLFGFLQFAGRESLASIYVAHTEIEKIQFGRDSFKGFSAAIGEVTDVSHLQQVVDDVEALGLKTRSAVRIVESLDREVNKARLAIGAGALLILLIAAVGISNTMIIAVLERTQEFGIMKSIGARDSQILWLVLLEGLATGVLGAVLALLISFGLADLISEACRAYIESEIRGKFEQAIFRFTALDIVLVFVIAGVVCTLASLIPAWRAAKLDPVVALRRT